MASPQSYMPVLVVDSNGVAAIELRGNLRHSGFEVDVVTSEAAARNAMRTRQYGTVLLATDLNVTDLDSLAGLRRMSPRTWIIVISSKPHQGVHQVAFQYGADSVLIAPFGVDELTFRLSAFAHRSRPP